MQKKSNISGRFLLITYLIVAFNCSFSHDHLALYDKSCLASHCHEDFEFIHHEHEFHVGIFHFLGHLFEELRHIDNDELGDDHLFISPKTPSEKKVELSSPQNFYPCNNKAVAATVDNTSLKDPPDYSVFLQKKLIKSAIPLRAPPLSA